MSPLFNLIQVFLIQFFWYIIVLGREINKTRLIITI